MHALTYPMPLVKAWDGGVVSP